MAKLCLLISALLLVSCSVPRYQLPLPSWYSSLNHSELSHWISYWEKVLQDENRKCHYNFPHDHSYHEYVIRHLNLLYRYRGYMELQYHSCNYNQNFYNL